MTPPLKQRCGSRTGGCCQRTSWRAPFTVWHFQWVPHSTAQPKYTARPCWFANQGSGSRASCDLGHEASRHASSDPALQRSSQHCTTRACLGLARPHPPWAARPRSPTSSVSCPHPRQDTSASTSLWSPPPSPTWRPSCSRAPRTGATASLRTLPCGSCGLVCTCGAAWSCPSAARAGGHSTRSASGRCGRARCWRACW